MKLLVAFISGMLVCYLLCLYSYHHISVVGYSKDVGSIIGYHNLRQAVFFDKEVK